MGSEWQPFGKRWEGQHGREAVGDSDGDHKSGWWRCVCGRGRSENGVEEWALAGLYERIQMFAGGYLAGRNDSSLHLAAHPVPFYDTG